MLFRSDNLKNALVSLKQHMNTDRLDVTEQKFELLIAQNHQTAVAANLCDLALELNIPVLLITGESNPKELKKARFYASRIIQIKSTEKEMIIKNVN